MSQCLSKLFPKMILLGVTSCEDGYRAFRGSNLKNFKNDYYLQNERKGRTKCDAEPWCLNLSTRRKKETDDN